MIFGSAASIGILLFFMLSFRSCSTHCGSHCPRGCLCHGSISLQTEVRVPTLVCVCVSDSDMLPKTRLGKRSPLGALVSSTSPPAGPQTGQEMGETGVTMATAAGQQAISRVKGHLGLKVRHFLSAFNQQPQTTFI